MNKIVMAEDDPIVARVYRELLERNGFEVHIVRDGARVLDCVKEVQPNAVLLDVMLPHVNGLELLKQIHAVEGFANLPVCIFTNAYVDLFINKAKEAGAIAVFNKATTSPRLVIDRLLTVLPAPSC
jgi:CheY-like chemotaxis protein